MREEKVSSGSGTNNAILFASKHQGGHTQVCQRSIVVRTVLPAQAAATTSTSRFTRSGRSAANH